MRKHIFSDINSDAMTIYFIFSDEAGNYIKDQTEDFTRKNPYFVRGTVFIKADDWAELFSEFKKLKQKYDLPEDKDMKFSYVWSLQKHKNRNEPVPDNRDYSFLKEYDPEELMNFVQESLELLQKLSFCKIFCTVTSNFYTYAYDEEDMHQMHLKNVLQRIQMEIQYEPENLGVLFIDSLSPRKDNMLRNIYANIYHLGDFIKEYTNIKDSLNIELSHQSVGIQIADYVSGVWNGLLRDYPESSKLFNSHIRPLLRKNGEIIIGYGVVNIPSNKGYRNQLIKKYAF
jgi:hypothetical protein